MLSKGKLFILSAPAGTGKTSLIARLVKDEPEVEQSLSFTTRPPRKGEVEGDHYAFVSKKAFEEMIERGAFLEYVVLFGNYYGTSLEQLNKKLEQGKKVVLVIDTQGALKLKGKVEAEFIFLSPPSLEVLKKRLLKRRTECDLKINERLEVARHEIEKKGEYDVEIVNDDFEETLSKLKQIIIG